jgi:hypothetical protein
MSRKDRRGRDLKLFLQAEIVGREIELSELLEALQIKPSRWYDDPRKKSPGRKGADDFPNADELLHVAQFYAARGFDVDAVNLMVEFGLIDSRPGAPGYTQTAPSH